MAKKKPETFSAAQILLGERILQLRLRTGLTRKYIGRKVKVTEQQIARYESGAFIPIATLEHIALLLGEPIQKKLIRRISLLRKREIDTGVDQDELCDLYLEAFPDEEDEIED